MTVSVRIKYRKATGEIVEREIIPVRIAWTTSPFFKDEQWMLIAHSPATSKDKFTKFAMANIVEWIG